MDEKEQMGKEEKEAFPAGGERKWDVNLGPWAPMEQLKGLYDDLNQTMRV